MGPPATPLKTLGPSFIRFFKACRASSSSVREVFGFAKLSLRLQPKLFIPARVGRSLPRFPVRVFGPDFLYVWPEHWHAVAVFPKARLCVAPFSRSLIQPL